MDEFLEKLKEEKNYSDELMEIIRKLTISFCEVLGEKNIPKIFKTLEQTDIFFFEDISDASKKLTALYNNGKEYHVGPQASGSGFLEDDYFINEKGEIEQKFIIGIDVNDPVFAQTLAHELSHGISSIDAITFEDNYLKTTIGFNESIYEFSDNLKGKKISDEGILFNEIVTENLAMQVMDTYDKSIEHDATGYNGAVLTFKPFFKNDLINSTIIDGYINHNKDFINEFNNILDQEMVKKTVQDLYSEVDLENTMIKDYMDQIANLTPSEFFEVYISFLSTVIKPPEGYDRSTFSQIRKINATVVSELSNNIKQMSDITL